MTQTDDTVRQSRIFVLALVSTLVCTTHTEANHLELGAPLIRNFDADEYGGNAQVWSVVEDRRGVLYVATTSKLLEYDGIEWRGLDFSDGRTVRALAVDALGTV